MKPKNGEDLFAFLDRATKSLQNNIYKVQNRAEGVWDAILRAQKEVTQVNATIEKLVEENYMLRFRVAKVEGDLHNALALARGAQSELVRQNKGMKELKDRMKRWEEHFYGLG